MMGWAGRKLTDRTWKGESERECFDQGTCTGELTCAESQRSWREATRLRDWKKLAATWRSCRCRSSWRAGERQRCSEIGRSRRRLGDLEDAGVLGELRRGNDAQGLEEAGGDLETLQMSESLEELEMVDDALEQVTHTKTHMQSVIHLLT